jgi:hypothetical protein
MDGRVVVGFALICFVAGLAGCYPDSFGSHPCAGCLECEECVEGPDGPRCAAIPEASLRCAADGNVHSYDSCDADEGVYDHCPEHAECVDLSTTDAECVCLEHWLGAECELGCDDTTHDLCETVISGGETYYCTLQFGVWQWRTSPICDDGIPCTYDDQCTSSESCHGTHITCADSDCMARECNGTSACTETPKAPDTECGTTACADADYCEESAFWTYPETCTRHCSGTGDVCEECTCDPSATACQAGPGNECCTATCSASTGCGTQAGACAADTCEAGALTVGRTCQGCGLNLASGACTAGTTYTCDAASTCAKQTCGGDVYQCRLSGTTWKWTVNPCESWQVCNGGLCAGGTTGEPCVDDGMCESGVCHDLLGICVVASCVGQDDFTPCEVVTSPDRSFDICVEEVCVSPGCGDGTCNTPGPHFPLADTNQRLCYDNSAQMTCPAPEQDYYGQDAQYGWDVTNAEDLRYARDLSVSGQPVVLDNVTGLVWQGCPFGNSGDDCAEGDAIQATWTGQLANCDALDWGGHEDWRLPDQYELLSIADRSGMNASTISATVFPNTPLVRFWSSSSSALNTSTAWFVYFLFGSTTSAPKGWYDHARCVRSGPLEGRRLEPSVLSGDRVVVDTVTGLVWQGCSKGQVGDSCAGTSTTSDWQSALSYCDGLSWGGYDDWRLPNVSELQSIVDNRRTAVPSINIYAFPNTPTTLYWSSSSYASNGSLAWCVTSSGGSVNYIYSKTNNYSARCVRDRRWD